MAPADTQCKWRRVEVVCRGRGRHHVRVHARTTRGSGGRTGCYDSARHRTDGRMSQVDVVTKSPNQTRRQSARTRLEALVRDFEWTWTNAVLFSLALVFFLLIATVDHPVVLDVLRRAEARVGRPDGHRGALSGSWAIFDPVKGFPHLGAQFLLQIRDAIAMGLTTGPDRHRAGRELGDAELAEAAARWLRRLAPRWRVPVGAACPSRRPRSTSTTTTSSRRSTPPGSRRASSRPST